MIWVNNYENEPEEVSVVTNATTRTTTTFNSTNPFLTNPEAYFSAMTTANTHSRGLTTTTLSSSLPSAIIPIQDGPANASGATAINLNAATDNNITAVTVASATIKVDDVGVVGKCIIDKENDVCKLDAKLVLILQENDEKNNSALYKDNGKEMAMIKPTIHNNNKTNRNNNNYNNDIVDHLTNNIEDDMAVVSCDESSALSENTDSTQNDNYNDYDNDNDNDEDEDDDDDDVAAADYIAVHEGGNSNSSTLQGPLSNSQNCSSKISVLNSSGYQQQQQQTASSITFVDSSNSNNTPYQYLKPSWSNNNINDYDNANNKCSTTTVTSMSGMYIGNSDGLVGVAPQTTEGFLSSLGVDISGLCTTNNALALQQQQQQSAKQLTSTFLADKINTVATNILANSNYNMNTTNTDAGQLVDVDHDGEAKIMLICEKNSHPFQTRTIIMTPNMEYKVGRLIAKSRAAENNAIFDCKVLSRNHAVLWYTAEDKKFWVKDTKSSNGTFINEQKLGNDAAELHFGDIVKFGVEVIENTRKEIHGCIIASVKLYLPDGREAISIDSLKGEKFIAYDELHRLNQFIQELMQREKNLKSTLFNIQNILDATRKNSGMCWQALIAEDQLLHRIHMYEKKLQIMDKNVPENTLRNEIIQLMEEKNSYQQAAKETLRKVYQERCEAMQLLAKMESAYAQSENECQLLRDQVMSGKQCLQEVSNRLLQTEAEFIEYKKDMQLQKQDAKEQVDSQLTSLINKLRERETECENFKEKINILQIERTTLIEENEKCKALNQLDAVIADLSGSQDCYDFTKDTDAQSDFNGMADVVVQLNNTKNELKLKKRKMPLNKKTTAGSVFELFKNSDLCNNEDVMKAFYNEHNNASESSDDDTDIESMPLQQFMPIKSENLQSVYNNLLELEAHIKIEAHHDEQLFIQALKNSHGSADEAIADISKAHTHDGGNANHINEVLAKKHKSYDLLKTSVALLRDAYNDIIMSGSSEQRQEESESLSEDNKNSIDSGELKSKLEQQNTLKDENEKDETEDKSFNLSDNRLRELEASITAEVKAASAVEINEYRAQIMELIEKMQLIEINSNASVVNLNTESDALKKQLIDLMSEIELLRNEKNALQENLTKFGNLMQSNANDCHDVANGDDDDENDEDVTEEENVSEETETENDDAINTGKVTPSENKITPTATATTTATVTRSSSFEQQMQDELYMDAIATEREEELIMYKDNYHKLLHVNLELRNGIIELTSNMEKNIANPAKQLSATSLFIRYIVPYAVAAFAIYICLYSYF